MASPVERKREGRITRLTVAIMRLRSYNDAGICRVAEQMKTRTMDIFVFLFAIEDSTASKPVANDYPHRSESPMLLGSLVFPDKDHS